MQLVKWSGKGKDQRFDTRRWSIYRVSLRGTRKWKVDHFLLKFFCRQTERIF